MNIKDTFKANMITAILRGIPEAKTLDTVQALYDGGLRQIECTFNQSEPESFNHTAHIIEKLREHFGEGMLIGAGTVLTEEQCRLAVSNGAQFILSPDMNEDIIGLTKKLGVISIPGAYTPTEIVRAYKAGADFVKLFPASAMGTETVKAITAPLSHIPFIAVGGIDANNMLDFAKAGCCGFGMGGKLVSKASILANDFAALTAAAADCCDKLRKAGLLK